MWRANRPLTQCIPAIFPAAFKKNGEGGGRLLPAGLYGTDVIKLSNIVFISVRLENLSFVNGEAVEPNIDSQRGPIEAPHSDHGNSP